MLLNKWNYEKHSYDLIDVPDDWNCSTYEYFMDTIIHCPHCGKQLRFGDSYTSLEYHAEMGFGYAVCEPCYELEWKRRKKYKGE